VTEPRWIVHADGRVSEFDRSQIAADLYRARCLQERIGAAKFAAEFTSALLHFAAKEIASPVWREDRLKALGAEVLTELGHPATAANWLQTFKLQTSPPSAKFSDDLIGLAEEGLLQFNLNLEAPKVPFRTLDAARFIGGARNAREFVAGLLPSLIHCAGTAEFSSIRRIDVCAALLHEPDEIPADVAEDIVSMIVGASEAAWAAIALDLRGTIDANIERLASGGPMFPAPTARDAQQFLRDLTKALLVAMANRSEHAGFNLVVWISGDRLPDTLRSLTDFKLGPRVAIVVDPNPSFERGPIVAEIGLPSQTNSAYPTLTDYDNAMLDAAMRIAVQRRDAFRRLGTLGPEEDCRASVHFLARPEDSFLDAVRLRVASLGKSFGLAMQVRLPVSDWWFPMAGLMIESDQRVRGLCRRLFREYDQRILTFVSSTRSC
jgi:hypothetical protein